MMKTDARKENTISILRSVARGNRTIKDLQNDTGIGHQTIWEITNELQEKKYLINQSKKQNRRGRRPKSFDISTNFYSTFVIEQDRIYSIISIDIEGRVKYRYDYYKRRNLSHEDDVKGLITKIKRAPLYSKNCVDVFITCSKDTEKYLPKNFIVTSMEDLILNGLSDERTIALFRINGKFFVSIFSKIKKYDDSVSEADIKKILPIDEYFEYEDELFYGVFDALQNNTIKNFFKMI